MHQGSAEPHQGLMFTDEPGSSCPSRASTDFGMEKHCPQQPSALKNPWSTGSSDSSTLVAV